MWNGPMGLGIALAAADETSDEDGKSEQCQGGDGFDQFDDVENGFVGVGGDLAAEPLACVLQKIGFQKVDECDGHRDAKAG